MVNNKAADLFNVNGLVAVITGGGSGLGKYAARALDANGAKAVYIVGRREEALREVAKGARNIIPIVGDVTSKESLEKVAEQVSKEQGYVNLLFANAGVIGPIVKKSLPEKGSGLDGRPSIDEMQKALWGPSMEEFTNTSHVNCTGVFYTAVAFMALLDAGNKQQNVAQDSQIIVTTSIAGFSRELASGFSYSASKAGLTHLVKMLSTSFAQNRYRIRCNLIAPGLYPSEMTGDGLVKNGRFSRADDGSRYADAFDGAYLLKPEVAPGERTGSEQDFAGVILFMASQAGSYLNGETLVTDGGRLSQLPATY
ncbi:Hypothetical protein R9X50_00237800 [Acrodontium crateriforme]|uniref:Uncharacterized protein n=1 Tax=Acrodontium crateriforme TaxID=150365 RepID=A0AAQ3M0Q2_9PEZI|nr:Hypothetical protein R9X50_00237800 [Acrodontium crateriforme]